jgi:type VI secretion system protein ImpH
MATPRRPESPDVTPPTTVDLQRWPIAATLDREPWRFEFFQAVRLLQRMYPNRRVVGRFTNPHEEVARFGANVSVVFPASEIQAMKRPASGPVLLTVNFMGLTGPLGVLPLAYSNLVIERVRAKDGAMRDFYDLFNHRMISLFCQAWEKYRFSIAYERGERDRFSYQVRALIGLGTPGLENRQRIPDDTLLYFSGLLSAHTRSATGLRQLLIDYFGVAVELEQFVGAWYPVETELQCSLGLEKSDSERLNLGALVGDEIWDQQSKVRLRVGPLTLEQYLDFLPGGEAHAEIRGLAAFFAKGEFDVELQLVLRRDDVPPCELKGEGGTVPQLGWTSWVKSVPFTRDAGETVLELLAGR